MMSDKSLNLFDECAAECYVHLCTSSSWREIRMCTPGTIVNSQMTPTKINKKGTTAKERILVEQMILEGIQRHLE